MEQFGRINLSEEQLEALQTPCYVVNQDRLEENLNILGRVQNESGAKVLLAFKGFAMWSTASLVNKYLSGVSARSVNEEMSITKGSSTFMPQPIICQT